MSDDPTEVYDFGQPGIYYLDGLGNYWHLDEPVADTSPFDQMSDRNLAMFRALFALAIRNYGPDAAE